MSEPATPIDPIVFVMQVVAAILVVALPTWIILGYATRHWGWHKPRAAALAVSLAAFVGAFWWLAVGRHASATWMAAWGEEIAFAHLAAGAGTLVAVGVRQLAVKA